MTKQELIKEIKNYEQYYSLVNIEGDKLEFLETHILSQKLSDIITFKNNIDRLNALNINI